MIILEQHVDYQKLNNHSQRSSGTIVPFAVDTCLKYCQSASHIKQRNLASEEYL